MKNPAVYIVTNKRNGTLYTGVTSDLLRRIYEHKNKINLECFTAKYGCNLLVFYEFYESMPEAIKKEKQIKAGSRKDKLKLIEEFNPEWEDLYKYIL